MISWFSLLHTPPPSLCPSFLDYCINLTYLPHRAYRESERPLDGFTLFPRVMFIYISSVYLEIPRIHITFRELCHAPERFLHGTYVISLPCFHPKAIKEIYGALRRQMIDTIGSNDVDIIDHYIVSLFDLLSNNDTNTHAFHPRVNPSNRMTKAVIISIFETMTKFNSNSNLRRHNMKIALMAPFEVAYDVVLMTLCFRHMRKLLELGSLRHITPLNAIVACLTRFFDGKSFKRTHSMILLNLRFNVHRSSQDLAELHRAFVERRTTPPPSMPRISSISSLDFRESLSYFLADEEEDKENMVLRDTSNSISPSPSQIFRSLETEPIDSLISLAESYED